MVPIHGRHAKNRSESENEERLNSSYASKTVASVYEHILGGNI